MSFSIPFIGTNSSNFNRNNQHEQQGGFQSYSNVPTRFTINLRFEIEENSFVTSQQFIDYINPLFVLISNEFNYYKNLLKNTISYVDEYDRVSWTIMPICYSIVCFLTAHVGKTLFNLHKTVYIPLNLIGTCFFMMKPFERNINFFMNMILIISFLGLLAISKAIITELFSHDRTIYYKNEVEIKHIQ